MSSGSATLTTIALPPYILGNLQTDNLVSEGSPIFFRVTLDTTWDQDQNEINNDFHDRSYQQGVVRREKFITDMSKKMENGIENLDVPDLYAIMTKACKPLETPDSADLRDALKQSMHLRHQVYHNPHNKITMKDVNASINNVFDKLYQRFPKPQEVMDKQRKSVQDKLDEIEERYSSGTVPLEEYERFMEDRKNMIE